MDRALLDRLGATLAAQGFRVDLGWARGYDDVPGLTSFLAAQAAWNSEVWLHVLDTPPTDDVLRRLRLLTGGIRTPGDLAVFWGITELTTTLPGMVITERRPVEPAFAPLATVLADRPVDWADLAIRMMPVCDALAALAMPSAARVPITHGDVTADDLYVDQQTGLVRLGGFVRGAFASRPDDSVQAVKQAVPDALRLIDVLVEVSSPPPEAVEMWRAALRLLQHNPYAAALALREALESSIRRRPTTVIDDDVQFSLYRPSTLTPGRWHPVLAFAHKTDLVEDPSGASVDPVEQVAAQARMLLASENTPYGTVRADSAAALGRGADLMFELWVEGAQVNPPRAHLTWEESVHRVEFRVRTMTAPVGSRLAGGLRVFSAHLLIAEAHFTMRVGEPTTSTPSPVPSSTATADADDLRAEEVRRYRKIFASYSHRDGEVVAAVRRYSEITGDRYLVDSDTLRSGEIWSTRLEELIEEADVFQLFWSRHSMHSPHVRHEWEHALSLGRDQFVRPVFWEEPFPEDATVGLPPESLQQLHFSSLSPAPLVGPGSIEAEQHSGTTMIHCRVCGVLVPVGALFCRSCGAQLRQIVPALPPVPEPVVPRPAQAPVAPPPPPAPPPLWDDTGEQSAVRPREEWPSAHPVGPAPPVWNQPSGAPPGWAPPRSAARARQTLVPVLIVLIILLVLLVVVLLTR
jgi:hypothetical protein